MRETSAEVIEPRFAALSPADVRSKAAGELVTIADIEAEELLTRILTGLLPGALVVGEEACATDPRLLDGLGAAQAWLVDPLDGTANFVEGSDDWAVMVALCEEGRTVASWIWQPTSETMYTAEAGCGAARNGVSLGVTPRGFCYFRMLAASRYGPTPAPTVPATHASASSPPPTARAGTL